MEPRLFLSKLYDQTHIGGTVGYATRRNIFQRSLTLAITMAQAIASIVYENDNIKTVLRKYKIHP